MPRYLVPILSSVLLWLALPVQAGLVPGACSGRLMKWECVGVLTFTGTHNNTMQTVRLRFYDDQSTVVEVTRPSDTQRMLVTPDGVWFQDVPPGQPSGQSPFIDLPEGALLTTYLLGHAFPDGPDSVPEGETERKLDLKHDRIDVRAARAVDGTIRYTIIERGQVLGHGTYRAGELAPPAGGFDLSRWTRGEKPVRQMLKLPESVRPD